MREVRHLKYSAKYDNIEKPIDLVTVNQLIIWPSGSYPKQEARYFQTPDNDRNFDCDKNYTKQQSNQ